MRVSLAQPTTTWPVSSRELSSHGTGRSGHWTFWDSASERPQLNFDLIMGSAWALGTFGCFPRKASALRCLNLRRCSFIVNDDDCWNSQHIGLYQQVHTRTSAYPRYVSLFFLQTGRMQRGRIFSNGWPAIWTVLSFNCEWPNMGKNMLFSVHQHAHYMNL